MSLSLTSSQSQLSILPYSLASVLFERDPFEIDMMNILRFAYEFARSIRSKKYDIYSHEFWNNIFPIIYIRLLIPYLPSPQSRYTEPLSIMSDYFISGGQLLSSVSQLETNMALHDFRYYQHLSLEHNIGVYLYLKYHQIYKNKIRKWAKETYGFYPKTE